jgi:hypothetical protein
MPSVEYFATFEESISILGDLCAQGFRVVAYPGLFDEPRAPEFDRVADELVTILRGAPAFYLAGAFTRFPVQFQQLRSGPSAGKYIIDLHSEGPLMQSLLGRVNEVDGVPTLLEGSISYQDEYRNPENGQWAKASADVKAAHRAVVAVIKKRCVRHKAGATILIGPDALKLFETGQARVADPKVVRPPGA